MSWARSVLRMGPAWATAVLATTIMGSMIQSWQVQSGLRSGPMPILSDLAAEAALRDFTALAVPILTVFGVTLALAVVATNWLKIRMPVLAPIAWPLAGAAAIGATIGFIHARTPISLVAGNRALDGFILLCSAGAIGGFLFAFLKPPQRG